MTILKTIIFGDVPSYFQSLQNCSVWLAPRDDQLRNQWRKTKAFNGGDVSPTFGLKHRSNS